MASHSSILAWRTPWTEEPLWATIHGVTKHWTRLRDQAIINKGQLGSPGDSGVKNLPASAGDTGWIPESGRYPEEGNGNPLQYSCLRNPMDRGAQWATVNGVAKSCT